MRALALLPLLFLIACDAGSDTGEDGGARLMQQPDPCLLTITQESVEFDIWDELSAYSDLVAADGMVKLPESQGGEIEYDLFTIRIGGRSSEVVLEQGERTGYGFQLVDVTDEGWAALDAGETLTGEDTVRAVPCAIVNGAVECEDDQVFEAPVNLAVELEPAE